MPECIDKSLNFGVELIEETIRIAGEFLNEKIEINIRLASEKLLEIDVPTGKFQKRKNVIHSFFRIG